MLDLSGGDPESQIPCWPPSTYGGIRRMLCMFLLCELSAFTGRAARRGAARLSLSLSRSSPPLSLLSPF